MPITVTLTCENNMLTNIIHAQISSVELALVAGILQTCVLPTT